MWGKFLFDKRCVVDTNIKLLDYRNTINPRKNLNNSTLHLNTKGIGKLRQNITYFVTKDFSIWFDVTKTEPILDKNSIGKTSHKENVSLFNDVNNDNGSDRYFGEHLSLLQRKNFNCVIFAHININFIRGKFDLSVCLMVAVTFLWYQN